MFQKLSIKARLMLSFGMISLLLAAVGAVAFISFENISKTYGHVANETLPNATALGKLLAGQKDMVIAVATLMGGETDEATYKAQAEKVKAGRDDYEEAKKEYLDGPFDQGEEALWNKVEAAWSPFDEMTAKLVDLSAHGDHKEFVERDRLGSTTYLKVRKPLREAITNLVDFQEASAKKLRAKAEKQDQMAKVTILGTAVAGFVAALLMGFFLANSLSKVLTDISSRLASGALNVSAAAQQIAAASEQLSAAVTEQAASLQETSASIEEINAMIARNAENAQTSATSSEAAKTNVHEGQDAVNKVSSAITRIQESNDSIAKQTETSSREFGEIVQVIGEIANKTKVINEIVFQTKLLSFNASVEAARAGEHGKGFAVVAEEVGNLAQMSGNAAKEISDMLASSIKRVETIVSKNKTEISSLVENGKSQVATGGHVVQECEKIFNDIVHSVQEVDQMSSAISTASQEQKLGVQEVTRAVAQLSQVNSQNASASGQAASAAESLAAQSKELESLVKKLAETVGGVGKGDSFAQAAPKKVKATASKKVISMEDHQAKREVSHAHAPAQAKFVSGDNTPSSDDPRFQDV